MQDKLTTFCFSKRSQQHTLCLLFCCRHITVTQYNFHFIISKVLTCKLVGKTLQGGHSPGTLSMTSCDSISNQRSKSQTTDGPACNILPYVPQYHRNHMLNLIQRVRGYANHQTQHCPQLLSRRKKLMSQSRRQPGANWHCNGSTKGVPWHNRWWSSENGRVHAVVPMLLPSNVNGEMSLFKWCQVFCCRMSMVVDRGCCANTCYYLLPQTLCHAPPALRCVRGLL